MHDAAYEWVAQHATTEPCRVLDIGGRSINGTVRYLFPNADYVAIDLADGPGVDVIGDVCDYQAEPFDLIVCCEVLEHTDADILGAAHRLLRDGGTLIVTAAGPTRPPHSSVDGGPVRDGEFYRNVAREWLEDALRTGWDEVTIDVTGTDIRATAMKGTLQRHLDEYLGALRELAQGGFVPSGSVYLIGENGPEMFTA